MVKRAFPDDPANIRRAEAAVPPSTREHVFDVLRDVMDPEVPVISVVDLGIVRDAVIGPGPDAVTVTVTPTYSGCPAMRVIEQDITAALEESGFRRVVVNTVYTPAWTTDWIPAEARERLRSYGIAPPGPVDHDALVTIGRRRPNVRCPWCSSTNTAARSEFGSTACKAIHFCNDCHQPFEEFKAI